MAILKLYVYNRHNCHNRHLVTKKENLIMAMQRYKFIKNTIGNDQRHKARSICFNEPVVFGSSRMFFEVFSSAQRENTRNGSVLFSLKMDVKAFTRSRKNYRRSKFDMD